MTRIVTRPIFISVCALALSMVLGGCGIKPSRVEPPPGAQDTRFPATYPDPATDPQ